MPFVGITPPNGGRPPERPRNLTRKRVAEPVEQTGRPADEAELSSVEQVDAPEHVQDAASEEGHEDRTQHGMYNPRPTAQERPKKGTSIDIKG